MSQHQNPSDTAAPCRLCMRPTYLDDFFGPVHPCCVYWIEVLGKNECEACRISNNADANRATREARTARKQAQRRMPVPSRR